MARLCVAYFDADGSWTAPAGVTEVMLIGQGAGGGGAGGTTQGGANLAAPGMATIPYMVTVSVVPNTSYAVTIGTGGSGGASNSDFSPRNGGAGGDTTFGTLHTFAGACANSTQDYKLHQTFRTNGSRFSGFVSTPSGGGASVNTGDPDYIQYNGGSNGTAGYYGSSGGAGGDASLGTGANGGNATGFGAGGAGGGSGPSGGGTGGTGAPGQLWVVWVE